MIKHWHQTPVQCCALLPGCTFAEISASCEENEFLPIDSQGQDAMASSQASWRGMSRHDYGMLWTYPSRNHQDVPAKYFRARPSTHAGIRSCA